MTKIDPLASPSPPKTFPVVVKEMLGGMGSPYPHKEVRGSINQQMLLVFLLEGLQSSVFIGGYRARVPFRDEILWEESVRHWPVLSYVTRLRIDCQFYIGTWIIYNAEQWDSDDEAPAKTK